MSASSRMHRVSSTQPNGRTFLVAAYHHAVVGRGNR
jgi:hypothetical protein